MGAEPVDVVGGVLDHLLEGFQLIGFDWVYLYVDPVAARQGRTTPEALVGRTMWQAYPGIEGTPLFATMQEVMAQRTPRAIENLFEFADGTKRWFELRIEPMPQGLAVHSVDIDDRKRAQLELVELNAELERRVAERTRALEVANRELEAFCASVSHDLRAPLRAIAGFSEALAESSGSLDPEGQSHLRRIRAAASRMGVLIDDLLNLSKMARASVTRTEVDLSAMARTIAEELSQREPGRHVHWHIVDGVVAKCDRGLARIVLENLLGNA